MNSIPPSTFYQALLTKLHRPALWEHGRTGSGRGNRVDSCYRRVSETCWASSSSCRRNRKRTEDGVGAGTFTSPRLHAHWVHTSRNAQEQPSSSTRYLMVRGENHWLASHRQHVRNIGTRLSLFLRPSRSRSFLRVLGTSYDTTLHLIVASSSTTARALRPPRFSRIDGRRSREARSITDTPDSIVAHREICCHRFVVVAAPSCPFLETRSLSLPYLSTWLLLSTSHPVRSGLVSPAWYLTNGSILINVAAFGINHG